MASYSTDETIAAIASSPGGALRGIIRLSGPTVFDCLRHCFQASDSTADLPTAGPPRWFDGQLRVDDFFVFTRLHLWPTNRSYTGQPSAELHTLGSWPILQLALTQLCQHGARLAKPGEFTLRAFLSGRLDLPTAEAVLAVIDAHDQRHLRTALGQLAGGVSRPLQQLRDQILFLLAELEAGLDFVEEDIEFISTDELDRRLRAIRQDVDRLVSTVQDGSRERKEFRVVLVGAPNVGKSSLMNAMAGRSAAIVSDIAGTTRDYVEVPLEYRGATWNLVDTAGIDAAIATSGPDRIAQQRSAEQGAEADVCLVCIDASRSLNDEDRRLIDEYGDADRTLVVATKGDLPRMLAPLPIGTFVTSSVHGTGIHALKDAIHHLLHGQDSDDLMVASTATRCQASLRQTVASLDRAIGLTHLGAGEELVAAELRVCLDALGEMVGVVYTDDLLDRIFGQFCIGK